VSRTARTPMAAPVRLEPDRSLLIGRRKAEEPRRPAALPADDCVEKV